MNAYLNNNWRCLCADLPAAKDACLVELVTNYSGAQRHYHNLQHIEALLKLVDKWVDLLGKPDTLRWAIWYHDAIYNASRQDNEEKSAALAVVRMGELGLDQVLISDCERLILATKSHRLPADFDGFDAQFLLDIDLSILAAAPEVYVAYTLQIRQEYRIYPGFLYKKGRRKVLRHFLEMEQIFLTDLFFGKWETKARENLQAELKVL